MARHIKEKERIFDGLLEYLEKAYADRKIKIREWGTKSWNTIDFYLDGDREGVFRIALGLRANPDEPGIKM